MKLIIFILCVILIAGLLIRIILTRADSVSPLLMRLREAGIPVGDAERALAGGEFWQRQKALMTEREVYFMKGLFHIVDMKRWYLCPQVRVADLVQLDGKLRPRSRLWWQLFRMVSQWHVDVVIVERRTFSIVAAIELDDVSHLRPERKRRDILLEEVLRQAGIPLFRSHDAKKLQQMTGEWLDACKAGQRATGGDITQKSSPSPEQG
ncbi:DUF2726 domain-containing protein [Salmonella enterica]|nr:DUF2726 domain-containing protein [Salmonella enterica]